MNRRSFFNRQDTALTLLYKPASITQAIATARSGESDGADGIAIEIQRLPQEERTVENFKNIINSVQLPFMFIDYRDDIVHGADDEARQKYLLMAVEAGAEVVDIMGDLFDPSPRELTFSPEAIARQKELIEKIHAKGGKVLISSHVTTESLSAKEVLAHLQEQSARGADMLKIVVKTDTEESAVEAIRTMMMLHEKLDKPYIFLGGGKYGRFVRYNGLKLGVAIQFGVHSYEAEMLYHQPTLRSFKGVRENFQWDICNQPE